MGGGLRLELRQSQQLVMTPQLQQAIRLLQMSSGELQAFVAEEIERNPLLTADAPSETDPRAQPGGAPEAAAEAAQEVATPADSQITETGDLGLISETFDTGAENIFDIARSEAPRQLPLPGEGTARIPAPGPTDGDEGFEARLATPPSLRAHLLTQIGQMRAPRGPAAIAARLVDELDEAGYLRDPLPEIAARLEVSEAETVEALALLQRCEPTGVGARSLAECFALQLAEIGRFDPAIATLLAHLDLLAKGQRDKLCKLCGVDAEDLTDMIADLRRLDPRPAADFGASPPETLIADVFVRPERWGGWTVELNPDALPTVLIDRRYAAEIARGGEVTRSFLSACQDNAAWLVKSLDQRARTIVKVSTEIVRQQEAFLAEGPSALRPLSLKMVADAVGMHESTVSRVTSKKYMATERGIFELKFFFSNAVGGGDGGSATSAEAVRTRLRALVAAERPGAVLSDDQIVETLGREGIDIARRTVAKYRNSLGIPSSVERRRRHALDAAG